jgi:type IV pilus assembly protein PilE
MRSKNAGVTLLELMLVMLIIGVLSAIAVPGYRNYVMRASRADAKAALLTMAGQLERCFTRFNSYDPDDGCAVASGVPSSDGKYVVNITDQTSVGYSLEAVPQGGQAEDEDCATFTLDSASVKGVTGTEDPQRCWSR